MGAAEKTQTDDGTFQAHVVLRMAARGQVSEEQLEQHALDAVEALEKRAAGTALGPVVAWNVEKSLIELDLTVEASTNAEVHEKIAQVMAVIEEEVPVAREQAAETSAELAYA